MYNPNMEQVPMEGGEGRKDYTQDPHYQRNLRKWNMAQVEVMKMNETKEKVAEWSGKSIDEVTENDLADYWGAEGSERWREENKYNSEFFDYIGE